MDGAPLTVLLTNLRLDGRTGTETWLFDFAPALLRRGHRVVVYTPRPGTIADDLAAAGVTVVDDPAAIDGTPDIIHGHHTNPTLAAMLAHPRVPAVFLIHDARAWHDEPPRLPRVRRVVPVDDFCAQRARDAGVTDAAIEVVLNFVDLERFAPRVDPLPERPVRAVVFDNGATPRNHGRAIVAACRRASIAVDIVGHAAGTTCDHPETILPRYDLVFAKARAALEAMAAGCAVILFNDQGLGGLVTGGAFDRMRPLNFGRALMTGPLTERSVSRHIDAYSARDAAAVSQRVREAAGMDAAVDRFIAIYRRVIDEHATAGPDDDAELHALADYLRSLESRLEAGGRVPDLQWQLDRMRRRVRFYERVTPTGWIRSWIRRLRGRRD